MSRWDETRMLLELGGLDIDRLGPIFKQRGIGIPCGIALVDTEYGPALGLESDGYPAQWRADTMGVLAAFARLEGGSPAKVLSFARSWGLLNLCQHGKPASHNQPAFPERWEAARHCQPMQPEPIYIWQHYVRQASALMRIMGSLYRRKLPAAEDWRTVYEFSDHRTAAPWWERTIEADSLALALVLHEWIDMGGVRPMPVWNEGDRRLRIELADTLFGAIARDLVFFAARLDRLASCAECGGSYVPHRRPSEGRRSFCPSCREAGAPGKHSSRDYRARQKRT